ncbi:hypothetical protein [Nitrospira sp. BLG_2]|uniref:hypothetical protein n=1 Tax=Nitrospira sp. BLG_2 TaxID=3397507 RepID=UPI003B992A75
MMTSKAVGVLLGGTLLLLFSMPQVGDVASAADQKKDTQETQGTQGGIRENPCEVQEGRNVTQAEQDATKGSHVVFGEVIRVDGMTVVVKDKGGKEVSLHADEKTEKSPIEKGDHISANVDKNNHALWIRSNRGTDRRTEHVAGGCDPS